MKITLNWLRQYIDFDYSPEQLAERLTMLGLEVEGVHKVSGEFEGIVVGQVLTRDKVAGSDKLSVCKVADGKGEPECFLLGENGEPIAVSGCLRNRKTCSGVNATTETPFAVATLGLVFINRSLSNISENRRDGRQTNLRERRVRYPRFKRILHDREPNTAT